MVSNRPIFEPGQFARQHPDVALAVGRLAIAVGQLDYQLPNFIGSTLKASTKPATEVARHRLHRELFTMSKCLNVLEAATSGHAHAEFLADRIKKLRRHVELRNTVAHGFLVTDLDADPRGGVASAIRRPNKDGGRQRRTELDPQRLSRMADEVELWTLHISEVLAGKHPDDLPELPRYVSTSLRHFG